MDPKGFSSSESIIKTKSRGINLADNFAFTENVTGAGTEIEVDQWELPNHFDDGNHKCSSY